MYGGAEGGVRIGSSAVMQQSLLPSINDPGIWKVKCAPGKELALVRSLLLKVFDSRARGQPMHIKTAFCNATKGYIYVEALAEPYAREAITGLRGLYQFSFSRIPVQEMTTLLAVTVTKKPMKKGQWVRLKRGPLKGDLARVVDILDGGAKAIVQAIPRPDFSKTTEKGSSGSKAKPSQRMFDVEEARTLGLEVVRRPMPGDRHGRAYDFFNGDFYRDGYLFKEVTVATYIDAENVKPRLDELRLFQAQANKVRRDDDDPYDDDHGAEADAVAESQGLLKDIAAQLKDLGDEESKSSTTPYVAGDVVRVAAGELKNLVGRVVSVDEVTRTVSLQAIKSKEVNQEFDVVTEVEVHLLVKHILPGAHVKVLSGQHAGLTGRVVR
jgi:transcription elongation factor SPT5